MIAKMLKTYVVSHRRDRARLIEALGDLGVVHLMPVEPAQAVAPDKMLTAIDRMARAVQILRGVSPAGESPDIPLAEAADEVLRIQRDVAERRSRLASLGQQINHLAAWGDVTCEQLDALAEADVHVHFVSAPANAIGEIAADYVQPFGELPGKRSLVAAITRGGELELPDGCEAVERPARDRPSLRAEAAEIDRAAAADRERIAQLAHRTDDLAGELRRLRGQAALAVATGGGLAGENLYAVQGWVRATQADALTEGLASAGVHAGVRAVEPDDTDTPPTLVEYPRWARPIQGLFDILGTSPGYREFELSGAFMVALPIFAAMLIGDGGYGLLFLLIPALFYKKAVAKMGKPLAQLIMVIGFVSLVWGITISSFFGVGAEQMRDAGGLWAQVGLVLEKMHFLTVSISDSHATNQIMRLCFLLGAIHLSVAHLWRAVGFFPHIKVLGEVGWAVFLWGMMFVVNMLVLSDPLPSATVWLLAIGAAMAILFSHPSRNPIKWLGLGIADFPLAAISSLSDIISYVRLFAVGVASGVLAVSFNEMAAGIGTPLIAVPVVVLGHGLNIALAMIALFAHGVRLNMLEFSNNAGMEWSGYAFEPFTKNTAQEN